MENFTTRQIVAWIIAVLTVGAMLPWAIAEQRNVPNKVAIGWLTFFLGWTVIGWFVFLVMACSGTKAAAPQQIVINNTVVSN